MKGIWIPNVICDHYLKVLSGAEVKVLLVIARWPDVKLTHEEFMKKTGCSRKVVVRAIAVLRGKGMVGVENH